MTGVRCDVLVVGGGAAGLTVAFELTRQGRTPILLEAGPAVGGAVSAHSLAGLLLDAGAESFATARPSVPELLADLGLSAAICLPRPGPAWVRHEVGQAPLPAGGWLGIPTDPAADDVRRIIGDDGVAAARPDLTTPMTPVTAGETLGTLVRRRMGEKVLRRLVEPVVGGVHSVDPDLLEVATIAPSLPERLNRLGSLAAAAAELRGAAGPAGSAVAGLTGGMNTLTSALATAVRSSGRIVTDSPARAIERDGADWLVRTDEHLYRSTDLVLALPAPTAAHLLSRHTGTPVWQPVTTRRTAVRLITLVVDQPLLDDAPRGSGMLVSSHTTGVSAKAITHATAKWPWLAAAAGPGRHVLRLSYGRARPADAELPADLTATALADATDLLGVPVGRAQLVSTDEVVWESVQPLAGPGYATAIAGINARVDELPGLQLAGAWLAGTGLAAVVDQARRVGRELTAAGPRPGTRNPSHTAVTGTTPATG